MGILFAVFASISFAFSYTILKKSYASFPPSVAFFIAAILGLCIWVPFGLVFGISVAHFSLVLLYALLSAILAEAFFFYVLSKGEVSITGTVLASYPIYTIIFSMFINNEHLSLPAWIFVGLTIVGTLLVSSPSHFNKKELKKKQYVFWAFAGALAIGIADSLNKHIIALTSASTFLFALALVQIPVAFVYLFLEKQSLNQFTLMYAHLKKYQYSFFGAFFDVVGTLFLLVSFQYTLVSLAAPIGASYPGLMVILAVILLKEKLAIKDVIGVVAIILGVIGISFLVI